MTRPVLITGGSSGIGRAMVERFAADHRVTFTYRSGRERAEALVGELKGADVTALPLDQGDPASIDALVDAIEGPVHVLINNAGLGSKTVEGYTEDRRAQDLALLQVNAAGPLWLTEALLPGMRELDRATIINLSSVGGGITQFPRFRLADGMSKAAVAFMTRQLAAELTDTGVDVFAICPGATDTAMFEASTLATLDDAAREAFVQALPKGRLISPEEIAGLAHFLTTDAARSLHGAVLDASLGLGVRPGLLE